MGALSLQPFIYTRLMKALRDRVCLYFRAISKRDGQDQATYTDFQKEFGLDRAVESVSKQAKRR